MTNKEAGSERSLVPVLAVLAAGIGTLGWVTFLGGALLWISFGQAQLPRAEAVAQVPTSVLVAVGAEFVVAAAVAVLVVLVLLFFVEDPVHRLAIRAQARKRPARPLGAGPAEGGEGAKPAAGRRELQEHKRKALWAQSLHAGVIGGLVFAAAVACARVINLGHGPLPLLWGGVAVAAASLVAAAIGVTLYARVEQAGIEEGDSDRWGRRRYRFSVLGLVVFVAVPLVTATGVFFRALDAPRVEPIALLRADGAPLVGFFVAETSDRVFVGTFEQSAPVKCGRRRRCPEGAEPEQVLVPPRLLSLPRDSVRNLSIGPRLPINARDATEVSRLGRPRSAREWAAGAALILCEEAAGQSPSSDRTAKAADGAETGESSSPRCSADQVADLRAFAATEQSAIERSAR